MTTFPTPRNGPDKPELPGRDRDASAGLSGEPFGDAQALEPGTARGAREERLGDLVNGPKDQDPKVRQASAWALGVLGPAARDAVPSLAETLKDPDGMVRNTTACALGWIGVAAKEAVRALIELIKDQHGSDREVSAQSLGRIGPDATEAVPALTDALNDATPWVRTAAEEVIRAIRREVASPCRGGR